MLAVVGVVIGAGFLVGFLVRLGSFYGRAVLVTVPDTVEVAMPPGVEVRVCREVAGTHATVNRPLAELPGDLSVSVWDAETGAPIAAEPSRAWMRQHLMGMERHRAGVVSFVSPAHGRARVSVGGSFAHEEVFSVGAAPDWYMRREGRWLLGLAGVGAALAMAGLGMGVWRAARASGIEDPGV